MKIVIQTLHFTPTPQLNSFVTDRVSKLSHFYERILEANVCLKIEPSDTTENKVCEIKLSVPGNDLFARREGKIFEEAIAETVEALGRQVRKMKTKFENQRGPTGENPVS